MMAQRKKYPRGVEIIRGVDPSSGGEKGRILVVDDEIPFLEAMKNYLDGAGYRVDTASGLKEVFSKIRKTKYDAILVDLRMPGINGLELIRRIKEMLHPAPAFIVLTGYGDKDAAVEAMRLEVSDFLEKPIKGNEIILAVERTMRKKRDLAGPFAKIPARMEAAPFPSAAGIRESETANMVKDELTQMLIHDMRSFITAIRGNAEVMEIYGERAPREECLADIVKSADKLEGMVRDILEVKKLESGKLLLCREYFHPRDLIDEAARLKAAECLKREIQIHVNAPYALKPIHGDYKVLSRVLDNLLSNALEHMEDRGEIFITCAFHEEKERHEIEVRDTGAGIAEEHMDKIFDKYVTFGKKTRKKGSGLGLAYCKMAVREHGGNITVKSRVGEGSCFTIILPKLRETEQ